MFCLCVKLCNNADGDTEKCFTFNQLYYIVVYSCYIFIALCFIISFNPFLVHESLDSRRFRIPF